MSFLPLIFLLLFMQNKNNESLKNFFGNIDLNSLAPILQILGLKPEILDALSSPEFKEILNGNINLSSLLPLIKPIMESFTNNSVKKDETTVSSSDNGFLSPIEDIADGKIKDGLRAYFT